MKDLKILMPEESSRLVLIYQHASRGDIRLGVANKIRLLHDNHFPNSFALWAGAASIIFVSREKDRINDIMDVLTGWLGPCAGNEGNCHNRLIAKDPLFHNVPVYDGPVPEDYSINHDKYLYGE
jgi:hypothetical protein